MYLEMLQLHYKCDFDKSELHVNIKGKRKQVTVKGIEYYYILKHKIVLILLVSIIIIVICQHVQSDS